MSDRRNTNVRTYSRDEWEQWQREWDELGDQWAEWRDLAQRHNIAGTPNTVGADDWHDKKASQAALLARACDEDPELVRYAITVSRDWYGVLQVALEERDAAKLAAEQAERAYRADKATHATQREAAASIAGIMQVLADSVGTQPPAPVVRDAAVAAYLASLRDRAIMYHYLEQANANAASNILDADARHTGSSHLCTDDACYGMRWLLEEGVPTDSD